MSQTCFLIKDACEGDLIAIVAKHATRPMMADECEGLIDSAVWRQVEAEVYMPLQARLLSAISREVSTEASKTAQRMRSLKALPQTFWSIPPKMTSPSCWLSAVKVLNTIPVRANPKQLIHDFWSYNNLVLHQATILPSDKLDLLLRAVQTIERLSEEEHKDAAESHEQSEGDKARRRPSSTPLGADDIFPVFVFVLVQSDLWKGGEMVVLRELLSGLQNPERQRWSASAYYVATLEAAIEHIKAT